MGPRTATPTSGRFFMSRTRALTSTVVACYALVGTSPARAGEQARFRSSLTATVIIPSSAERGKSDRLGCREVMLHWAAHPASRRYAIYVSVRVDGPWSELPATNVCGA